MRRNKGITLVALVITIIVMLILAGVTISMLFGENGLITRAQTAVNKWEEAAQNEQEGINSILNEINNSTNNTGEEETITKSIKELQPGDYVNYIVPSISYTMTTAQTGHTSDQTYSTSSYTGNWQVLYDYTTHGRIEIISSDNILVNDTSTRLYLSGQDGYNNLVSTLNTMAGYYMNSTYATDARSVGSDPTNKEGNTSSYHSNSYSYFSLYNGKMLETDITYTTDVSAMEVAGVKTLKDYYYWLASRNMTSDTNVTYFYGRFVTTLGEVRNSNYIWNVNNDYPIAYVISNCGVRPVITLKSNVRVVDSGVSVDGKTVWNIVTQ